MNMAGKDSSSCDQQKIPQFCVAVLGIPSHELSRSTDGAGRRRHIGVGKSCLCSRFTSPSADSYFAEEETYPSVVSEAEFRNARMNSNHFLYFGKSHKHLVGSDQTVEFHVVEQTTLVDENYRPHFSPSAAPSALKSYVARAVATELCSPGKRVYSRENRRAVDELGAGPNALTEREMVVDGFVLLLDPTRQAHELQAQLEVIEALVQRIAQLEAPYALALTKSDSMTSEDLQLVEETVAFHLAELIGDVPIFHVSARQAVAVDQPFLYVFAASHGRARTVRPTTFAISSHARAEAEAFAEENMQQLVDKHVARFTTTWSDFVHSACTSDEECQSGVIGLAALCTLKGAASCVDVFRLRLASLLAKDYLNEFRQKFLASLAEHPDRPDQALVLGKATGQSVFCPCHLLERISTRETLASPSSKSQRTSISEEARLYYANAAADILGPSTARDGQTSGINVFHDTNQEKSVQRLLQRLLTLTNAEHHQEKAGQSSGAPTSKKRWSISHMTRSVRTGSVSNESLTSPANLTGSSSVTGGAKRKAFRKRPPKDEEADFAETSQPKKDIKRAKDNTTHPSGRNEDQGRGRTLFGTTPSGEEDTHSSIGVSVTLYDRDNGVHEGNHERLRAYVSDHNIAPSPANSEENLLSERSHFPE